VFDRLGEDAAVGVVALDGHGCSREGKEGN
jgi:hypothetical protein